MLLEVRTKSQITIPKELMTKLSLEVGDKLEVFEEQGALKLIPVKVYPKEYVKQLQDEIEIVKKNIKDGKQPIFDNIDDLVKSLNE